MVASSEFQVCLQLKRVLRFVKIFSNQRLLKWALLKWEVTLMVPRFGEQSHFWIKVTWIFQSHKTVEKSSFTAKIWKYNSSSQAGNFMFKINNRNTRKRSEICSKLTIKILERHQWQHSRVFIVNFEHISYLVLLFYIANFEQANLDWVKTSFLMILVEELNKLFF